MGSLFAIFCVTYVLYQNTFCNRIVSIFVQASNIGYTSNPFAGTNSIAVKGRVEIFAYEKILPDLDGGNGGIIICPSAWTYLSAQAFIHFYCLFFCSASKEARTSLGERISRHVFQ